MVADVTETRNVIPSLEFKTCMTLSNFGLNPARARFRPVKSISTMSKYNYVFY